MFTDAFAINWPPQSNVRVIANSLVASLHGQLLGHDPNQWPREVVADEAGRPIYRFSTDSPLRITTGELEQLALFAGQVSGSINSVPSTAELIAGMVECATARLQRLCA